MSKRPHIIYIMSDEHRGQAMSHTGDPNLSTPALDRLAREGVSFEQAYANCPVCTPSRGTIFSGRHAHSGPVSSFYDAYTAAAPSTATILKEYGYRTAYFGKWHCGIVKSENPSHLVDIPNRGGYNRTPERHRAGFDDWYAYECINEHFATYYYKNREITPRPLEGYSSDALTDLVVEYLQNYDGEEPLFLVVSYNPPHFPFEVPEKWKRFNEYELDVRPNFSEKPIMRERLALYYAMIENLDWNIGRIEDTVQQTPAFKDNTLSVYFSDHGEFIGSHGWEGRKELPHEESVRIPAIFHWPQQIPARGNINGMFSLVDLLPTTLGLLNIPTPSYCQGYDYTEHLVNGDDPERPSEVLLEMCGNPRHSLDFYDWRAVLTQKWKYTFYETGAEELFDLEEDPYELENCADTYPEVRQEMKNLLLEKLRETREPFFDVIMQYGVKPEWPDIDVRKVSATD